MDTTDVDRALVDGWASELRHTGRVTLIPGRGRLVLILLATVLLTLGCLGAALSAEELKTVLAGWAGVLLFGVIGIPTMCKNLVGDRFTVTVDSVGVNTAGTLVPWHEIQSVSQAQTGRHGYVRLGVDPKFLERTGQQGSLITRGMAAANRRLSHGEFIYLPSVLRRPGSLASWLAQEMQAREVPSSRPT